LFLNFDLFGESARENGYKEVYRKQTQF